MSGAAGVDGGGLALLSLLIVAAYCSFTLVTCFLKNRGGDLQVMAIVAHIAVSPFVFLFILYAASWLVIIALTTVFYSVFLYLWWQMYLEKKDDLPEVVSWTMVKSIAVLTIVANVALFSIIRFSMEKN